MENEKRLIDANAIEYPDYFYEHEEHPDPFIEGFRQGKIDAINDIRALAPTVDAVEVVHGQWEQGDHYDYGDVCSVCDWDSAREPCKWSYCPNCGAKMDGVGNGKPER